MIGRWPIVSDIEGGELAFSFIHCSDLHLGTPFSGLRRHDDRLGRIFESATFATFAALCEKAIREEVDFFVIAGDVYDGVKNNPKTARLLKEHLVRLVDSGIDVLVALGNHDHVGHLLADVTEPPDGVYVFSKDKAQTFRLASASGEEVVFVGRSFPAKRVSEDLSQDFPNAEPGLFNVGVLHCTLDGAPLHEGQSPTKTASLLSKGYQYWALGHIHTRMTRLEGSTYLNYCGNLQGLSMKPSERGPKGALLVKVDSGQCRVEFLPLAKARFESRRVNLYGDEGWGDSVDEEEMISDHLSKLEEEVQADEVMVLRLSLVGTGAARLLTEGELSEITSIVNRRLWQNGGRVFLESIEDHLQVKDVYLPAALTQALDDVAHEMESEGLDRLVQECIQKASGKMPGEIRSELFGELSSAENFESARTKVLEAVVGSSEQD
jgi:DNA repair exonuclease SbcCD nuclease subunit